MCCFTCGHHAGVWKCVVLCADWQLTRLVGRYRPRDEEAERKELEKSFRPLKSNGPRAIKVRCTYITC